MFAIILALLLQIEPIPDPVPDNGFGGPLEALREMVEQRFQRTDERLEQMEGGLLLRIKDATRAAVENLRLNERVEEVVAAEVERRGGRFLDLFTRLFDRIESLLNLVIWIIGLGCVLYALQIISRFIPSKVA